MESEFGNLSLEFDYLSSSKKLFNYQSIYFENELSKKNINEIKMIKKDENNILIYNFDFQKKND